MPNNITLLDRAKKDLKNSMLILKNADDEVDYDVAAYLLQQTVEKIIKFELSLTGDSYPLTHDIEKLLEAWEKKAQVIPDWLWDNALTLTNYATKTRYGKQLVATRRRLESLYPLVRELLEQVKVPDISSLTIDEMLGE